MRHVDVASIGMTTQATYTDRVNRARQKYVTVGFVSGRQIDHTESSVLNTPLYLHLLKE